MRKNADRPETIDSRIAGRLKELRAARGWSLDELAKRSEVSRATLSRLEKAEVSASAAVLGKLCAVYGLPMSRLIMMAEADYTPLLHPADQPIWKDTKAGFTRRSLSPPAEALVGEAVECVLAPGARIAYSAPPRPGLEHHLLMREGKLTVRLDETVHTLSAGDSLRYRLFGASSFETPAGEGARYILFLV
jgi:transcriptional regulator with XRE-family HTH domain